MVVAYHLYPEGAADHLWSPHKTHQIQVGFWYYDRLQTHLSIPHSDAF